MSFNTFIIVAFCIAISAFWIKMKCQMKAQEYRLELADEVHKVLNDPDAPEGLVDLGLETIEASFEMGLAWRLLYHIVKTKASRRELVSQPRNPFGSRYKETYRNITSNFGAVVILNSPLAGLFTIFYLYVNIPGRRLDEKITTMGMEYHHANC